MTEEEFEKTFSYDPWWDEVSDQEMYQDIRDRLKPLVLKVYNSGDIKTTTAKEVVRLLWHYDLLVTRKLKEDKINEEEERCVTCGVLLNMDCTTM